MQGRIDRSKAGRGPDVPRFGAVDAIAATESPNTVYAREWRRRNPERNRALKKRENDKLRADVIAGHGGKCACCGNDFLPHLTIDHINGGGRQERLIQDARCLHRRLRREGYPPGYQVLCWNCNSAKHFQGECRCQEWVT